MAYNSKVVLAWAEAVGGNKEIRDWLMTNGFPELGLFVFALHHKREAREWLLENKFPHLIACVECAEGKESACQWLTKFDFGILEKVGRAGDNQEEALSWLVDHGYQDFARLAIRIRNVKNDIQSRHDDMHFISPE
ncbi:MAG: hypothetical protein RL106_1469 [Bacteroidota bacterium]|jgi:hypothetical protein